MSEPSPPSAPVPLDRSGAVIVGGTSGVGLATAVQLRDAGVRRLVLVGRNPERGEAARARLATGDVDVHFVGADATSTADARRAADEAERLLGGVDILINSTVPQDVMPELLFRTPIEDISSTLCQLALAPMHMTHAVLPGMRARRSGAIVNIASDAAKVATPGESTIGAAMAAIVMFSRTVAMEAKRDGIRVNVLTPSLITGTPTGERVLREGFGARLFGKAAEQAHLGVADADDLAALVVFLAGPAARRITGQAISVNGGISAA
ncbi:MAG: SDR family NAD(P)-dependent oxidoreductase [Nocardioidaceae bacterium]